MAIALGPRVLRDIAFPTGIDGAEVYRFQMQNGMTGQQAIALAATGIGQENETVLDLFGGMIYITENNFVRYRQGSSATKTPVHAELGINDPVRSETIGHMLPTLDYQDTLAWSRKFLQRADTDLLRADIDLIRERWRNRVASDIWTRALTNTETAIGAGYDVPWAVGSGMNVNYIPTQYGGMQFDGTHTHFVWVDDSTGGWSNLFDEMMEQLRHHGHMGILSIFVSMDDLSEIRAADGFAPLERSNIVVVGGNAGSPIRYAVGEINGVPGEVVGYYNGIWGQAEVRWNPYIPTNYAFATKSYGANNPRNGLALRAEPNVGFGLKVVPQLDRSPERQLDYLLFEATHGVGVNDRTNGVAGYLNNGANAWVNPTLA